MGHAASWPLANVVHVHTVIPVCAAVRITARATSYSRASSLALVSNGWIPSIVSCLQNGSNSSHQLAAASLRRVSAANFEVGAVLAQAGAMQPLAQVLRKGGPANTDAVATLRNMVSSHYDIGLAGVRAGLPAVLLDVMSDDSLLDVKIEALGCMSGMVNEHCHLLRKAEFKRLYDLVPTAFGWLSLPGRTPKRDQWIVTGVYSIGRCHPRLKARVTELGWAHFLRIYREPDLHTPISFAISKLALQEFVDGAI